MCLKFTKLDVQVTPAFVHLKYHILRGLNFTSNYFHNFPRHILSLSQIENFTSCSYNFQGSNIINIVSSINHEFLENLYSNVSIRAMIL